MRVAMLRRILPYLPEIGSMAFRRKIVDLFPHEGVQMLKTAVDVMHRRSVEIYGAKKRALAEGDEVVTRQVGEGKDIMSILRTSTGYMRSRASSNACVY